jgi:hypothetical protein
VAVLAKVPALLAGWPRVLVLVLLVAVNLLGVLR